MTLAVGLMLILLVPKWMRSPSSPPWTRVVIPAPSWSPYLVGAGIGILSWLTFYISDKPIGASSFYATVAGFIGKAVRARVTPKAWNILRPIHLSSTGNLSLFLLRSGGAALRALTEWRYCQ